MLQGQFEEQAAPEWQDNVVRAVPGLEEANILQDGAETPKVDPSGVPVVKKAVSLNSMETKEDLEGSTVPTEEAIPDTEVTDPARLERRLSYSKAGETKIRLLNDTEEERTLEHSASENNVDAESVVEPPSEPTFEGSDATTRIESPDAIIEDKEMVHHDSVLESLDSNWPNRTFSPLHSVSSMTVEVGDVPASETLSVLSEADDDASKFELDISNDFHGNDNVDLDDDFIEFKIVDSADVYKSLMEDKQLLHGAQNVGSTRTTVIEKSPSRLHSMNSMFVEIGDNPPAESETSGPSEAEDHSSYHDLDNFDGYEVTVVEDGAAPPLIDASETVPAGQSTPPESSHTNGEVPNYEVSTDASSEPENTLGDFVQDAHEGSRTTFVSEWAANNLSLPTLISDKVHFFGIFFHTLTDYHDLVL